MAIQNEPRKQKPPTADPANPIGLRDRTLLELNSAMSPRQMKVHCQIDAESAGYLKHAMEEMNFSARAHDRILKVARTLADLAGAVNIRPTDR